MTSAALGGADVVGWRSCLDDLAQHLEQQRAALADGDLQRLVPFCPPRLAGPVPAELQQRALDLLQQTGRLEDELRAARDESRRQLRTVRRMLAGPGPSLYFEQRA